VKLKKGYIFKSLTKRDGTLYGKIHIHKTEYTLYMCGNRGSHEIEIGNGADEGQVCKNCLREYAKDN
jgi:hypothetical protein